MSVTDAYGRKAGRCIICRSTFWIERVYHEMGLCEDCTCKAGDAYYLAHSGEHSRILNPEAHERARLAALAAKGKRDKIQISQKTRWTVFKRDDYKCTHCGSRDYLEVDHILAEAKGGTLALANLQTLCKPCNASKRDRETVGAGRS